MGDDTDTASENPNNHVTFQLVEEGSKRRKTKLVDSLGYSYNVRSKRSYATYWQCTVRPLGNACKATVIQRDGTFQVGTNTHNHSSEPGAVTAAKIVKLVKEKALEDKFKPASAIVEEVFKLHLTDLQVNLANGKFSNPLRSLTDYIQEQWIESTIFTPKDWSVFKQPIRTNNDIEGWHNALNRRAGGQCRLQFYLLIELLHREARLTSITIKLVSDKKLKRIQRRKYRQLQQKLFDAWEQYQRGNKSASQLLRCCSHLNGPARCQ